LVRRLDHPDCIASDQENPEQGHFLIADHSALRHDFTTESPGYSLEINGQHRAIDSKLNSLGELTSYAADANEPNPRHLDYGVRALGIKRVICGYKPKFRALDTGQKIELVQRFRIRWAEKRCIGLL